MILPEIIITEDGSNSLFSQELNESYHSKFGAIKESNHVFIDAGLKRTSAERSIRILEIGFGTGLNAWLTLLESIDRKSEIIYHTIEPFPIPPSIYRLLNFAEITGAEKARSLFISLHESAWDREVGINEFFKLKKEKKKLEDTMLNTDFYDLIYYDAFSPEVQPELWTTGIFNKIFKAMKVKGILVTYCAKGYVRRNLKEAGFEVERIAGPTGKREMIRAFRH